VIVDFHCHLVPPRWRETRPVQPAMADIEGFLERKAADGIDVAVVGNAMVNMPGSPFDNLALDVVRDWNEFAAELVGQSDGRIVALTGTNPFGGDEMLTELERALATGAFRGVVVNSSVAGERLDAQAAMDFWALADTHAATVFVHPPWEPASGHGIRDQRVLEYAGRAVDVALSVAGLVFAGVLDRLPQVRVVCAAGGGGLAALAGRLDAGAAQAGGPPGGGPPGGGPPGGGPSPPAPLPRPPSETLRRVYVDSCLYSRSALVNAVEVFGADRVLFGTDYPPVDMPASRGLDLVRSLQLDEQEQAAILGGNAVELLGL